MRSVLIDIIKPGDILIHGCAAGADLLSEYTFRQLLGKNFTVERYPANWHLHGKRAGPIRNRQMLEQGKPELVIAFIALGSRGTKNMVEIAKKAGIPVKQVSIETKEINIA